MRSGPPGSAGDAGDRTLTLEQQGQRVTFLGPPDPDAPYVEADVLMAPGAFGPSPHVHTRQTEYFHVISGTLVATVEGEAHTVPAGASLTVRPGQVHSFVNGSATEPLVLRDRLEPALHFQWLITEAARAAIRGGGTWRDIPLLEAAFILYQVRDEHRLAGLPVLVQDVVFGGLSWLARMLGKTRHISRDGAPGRGLLP